MSHGRKSNREEKKRKKIQRQSREKKMIKGERKKTKEGKGKLEVGKLVGSFVLI